MTPLPPDTVRRIEDAAAALIAAGTPNPTNEQVRAHLGGGSLSHISPVMRAFRARLREQRAEQALALPAELAQLLSGQLALLWQAAVKQADAGTLAAREQADADIAQADQERDAAQATVARLDSELAVLREVVAERDRLLQEVRTLRDEALPLHEQIARLTATGEHLATQLKDTKAELKGAREETRTLQAELLTLARGAGERSGESIPACWRDDLKAFPRGCCELASQTLVKYLRDHDPKLFPCVIATGKIENDGMKGHVFVALDGDYIDLILDQFDEYDDWILAEPIESGGTLGAFLLKVRRLEGTITTREVTLDVIPGDGHRLYGWLKKTADGLLAAAGQNVKPEPSPVLVSREIHPDYRDWPSTPSSPSAGHGDRKGK